MHADCRATTIEYMCTKFDVDSSSRFHFRARTNRQMDRQTDKQTDATERPTNAGGYTAGVGNNSKQQRPKMQTREYSG